MSGYSMLAGSELGEIQLIVAIQLLIVLIIMTVVIWKGVEALRSIAKSMRILVEQKGSLEDTKDRKILG